MAQPLPKLATTVTEHPNAFKLRSVPAFNLHIIFLPYGKSPNLLVDNYRQNLIAAMDLSSEQKVFPLFILSPDDGIIFCGPENNSLCKSITIIKF